MKFKKFLKKAKSSNVTFIIISVFLSILIWSVVKINFSEVATKRLTGIKVSLDSTLAEQNSFYPFFEEKDILVDVQISGKSYDLNAKSFSSSDIVIEASSGYVDSPGYKTLYLTSASTNPDITITSVNPSTITIFYDRKEVKTVDVEARLTNEEDELVSEGYTLGKPVPSFSTLEVEGPATIVSALNKVIFSATVEKKNLPLEKTTEVSAEVDYEMNEGRSGLFLRSKAIEDDAAALTVTIPVTRVKTVPVSVNFVNQPEYYVENPLDFKITPESVDVAFSSAEDAVETIPIGSIDFRSLKNGSNVFSFDAKASSAYTLLSDVKSFEVVVDLSEMSSVTLSDVPTNIVFTSQNDGLTYSVSKSSKNLKNIVVVGPTDSLKNVSAESLQVEINVSKIETENEPVRCKVSNIALTSESDCWVYGEYYCYVRAEKSE